MAKIKVRIPDSDMYPLAYKGKVIDVRIESIIFPDDRIWTLFGEPDIEVIKEENTQKEILENKSITNQNNLVGIIGEKPSKITVEF